MKILFMHPNMPGQFKYLCRAMAEDKANQVVFVTKPKNVDIPGVQKVEYQLARDASPSVHRYLVGSERAILNGQETWRVCKQLRDTQGFIPDVIVAHPGWGDALFMKDLFPDTPLMNFFEFYYHSKNADVAFDPEMPITEDDKARVRVKNFVNMMSLESADWGITPTHWQLKQYPKEFHSKISVIHDGVNTDGVRANPDRTVTLKHNGQTLTVGDEVVTYIVRNFEHYRGFPTFMRAAEIILKQRPNCHIIAVGADGVSYGRKPPTNTTFRQLLMKEVSLDLNRIHFPGLLPYADFLKILQISSAHIYLTYPFVLSWSMLEAMSAECLVVGSNTPPVMEVIRHGENGLIADFFSPEDVAQKVISVLDHKDRMRDLRKAARQTVVDRYDLKKLLPLHMSLISDLAEGRLPPPAAKRIEQLYQPQAQFHGKKDSKKALAG